MAIVNAIPQVWAARLLDGFYKANVWRNLFTDVSGEVSGSGDTINLDEITNDPTIQDYSVNTDMADAEIVTDAKKVLLLDKQKYFNITVDDVDAVQSKPAMLEAFVAKATRGLARAADADLFAAFKAATIPVGSKEITPNITSVSDDDALEIFLDALIVRAGALTGSGWPADGIFCVVPSDVGTLLVKLMIHKGYGSGVAADKAMAEGVASLSRLLGFPLIIDNNMSTTAATARTMAAFGHKTCGYAAFQLRRVEPYRMEKRFADAVKGLLVYGAVVTDDTKRFFLIQKA